MKFVVFLLALLPFTLGASIHDKRFIEQLFGGYDILTLAEQVGRQFGCDETEAQCESSMCPSVMNPIDRNNKLITDAVCVFVCKEVQVLAKNLGTPGDPCAAGGSGGVTVTGVTGA